jgi:hypothetical protein
LTFVYVIAAGIWPTPTPSLLLIPHGNSGSIVFFIDVLTSVFEFSTGNLLKMGSGYLNVFITVHFLNNNE